MGDMILYKIIIFFCSYLEGSINSVSPSLLHCPFCGGLIVLLAANFAIRSAGENISFLLASSTESPEELLSSAQLLFL